MNPTDFKRDSSALLLKPGKDKAIRHRHHWIFSGAVAKTPSSAGEGEIVPVYSADQQLLGSAFYNRRSGILGRMVAFDSTPPLEAIQSHLFSAINLRKALFPDRSQTNAYRLINGEGDLLSGLVVDRYEDVLVMQISTLGMERLSKWLVSQLDEMLHPRVIYEKSHAPARKEEGLPPQEKTLLGSDIDEVEICENRLRYIVSLKESQKTGFFLDHREMRAWIRQLAPGKRVLNAFAYTGAFSVAAIAGGASHVDTVDISESAIAMARRNLQLNDAPSDRTDFYTADLFQFLRERPLPYDIVILDPPAFAKRQKDVVSACRGYKDLNRLAMQKMPEKSLLLTASCSYHVNEELFQKVLFQAACEAGRTVRIVGKHRLAPDHPINLCHPETHYLKSFLLYVE